MAVSPPGASGKLAFSKADTLAGGGVVYFIYLLEPSGLIKVSSGNGDFHPTWGTLGHRIAFQRTHSGMNGSQIVVMSRYGGDEVAITPYGLEESRRRRLPLPIAAHLGILSALLADLIRTIGPSRTVLAGFSSGADLGRGAPR